MKQVKISHPKAGEATVPEMAVPHWRSRGWQPVDEQQPVNEQAEGKKLRRDSGGKDS